MSRVCEDCGLPLAQCVCEITACLKCGVLGCEGECDEIDLGAEVDIDMSDGGELNFDHDDDAA